MKTLILVGSLFLMNIFAGDTTDAAYQEYCRVEKALKESCLNYFKHDSLIKTWNKRTEIPEVIARIIQQDAIKDSVQLEKERLALLSKYKIREALAALACIKK
jgi:hypothetical protein